jgi:type II secretory pathway pseudopilin PulG
MNKAQGTVEYLIIIAIIIIIALLVVSLLVTNTQTSGSQEKILKVKWQSQEVAITDSIANLVGQATLVLKNNTPDTIRVTSITINNSTTNFDPFIEIVQSQTKKIQLDIPSCDQPSKAYYLGINYLSKYNLNKKIGPMEILINCDLTEDRVIEIELEEENFETTKPTFQIGETIQLT